MYSIREESEAENEIVRTKILRGYECIPDEDIDYIVNVLRAEGRNVIAVRDVPVEDPFESQPPSIAPKVAAFGCLALVVGGIAWAGYNDPAQLAEAWAASKTYIESKF